jgi:hypothetical protein
VFVGHFVLLPQISGNQVSLELGPGRVGYDSRFDDLPPRPPNRIEVSLEQSAQCPQPERLGERAEDLPHDFHSVHAGDMAECVHQGVEVVEARKAARRHEDESSRLGSVGRMP